MSGGLTSLDSAIRTCRVNTGDADRIQSNRLIGCPDEKMCPTFLGTDLTGRSICPDSFMTKSAGCNSPKDRIFIENVVSRPHYYEYITLSSRGLDGDTVEGFGFGQQGSSFIRDSGQRRVPSAVIFNASQTGQLQMPLWAYNAVPGMPYSQMYGRAAEEQRLRQALWARASALGQNPAADNPGRFEYKMMGEY